ncbi:MAG: carboxy-S-adenosyl-L-methionine synthase CmoA [Deltaproteobacteria bacterium]|nr:MAG: carboxy-S-adenosyl-L-methionine synthase CmoA [Deltaproteobacteria bacterium]
MAEDTLFKSGDIQEDFVFNGRVARVFDDMIGRSVPFYRQVILAAARILDRFLKDGDKVVDLGCATGTTLIELARLLEHKSLFYTGIDNSAAMLDKARLKADYTDGGNFEFIRQDITELNLVPDALILNYTLQFIRPLKRADFVQHLFNQLRPGGVLILSEKTIQHDSLLNREFIDIYHDFKKEMGYSELEIAKKREALENVLIPFSIAENTALLEKAGFTPVTVFFQWFNFASLVAVKPQ